MKKNELQKILNIIGPDVEILLMLKQEDDMVVAPLGEVDLLYEFDSEYYEDINDLQAKDRQHAKEVVMLFQGEWNDARAVPPSGKN